MRQGFFVPFAPALFGFGFELPEVVEVLPMVADLPRA